MNAPVAMSSVLAIRPEAEHAPESGIVEVANYARGRDGLIPLYVGEGDLSTPAFICEAATRALAAGETFYSWQRGIPDLRQALARYHERLYRRPSDPERFFVTIGGMHALQTAVRMIAGAGDEVVIPTPAWPNFAGALSVVGARVAQVPMTSAKTGWQLDLDRLEAAVTARTRAIIVNSPANPTGWTASLDELAAILAIARRRGLWIVADEIYARFAYDPARLIEGRAPSFRDVMEPQDRILFVQTFSKNWAMTGWRIGWLEAPAALGQVIENLIQYSTSGVPAFQQRAAVAALEHGESFVAHRSSGRGAAGRSSATGFLRPARSSCRRRPAPSMPSSRSRACPMRARSRCASWTRRMSALRPAPPSATAGRAICACASPANPRISRRRCAASPPCSERDGDPRADGSVSRRGARRFRLPSPRHPGGVDVGRDGCRGDPRRLRPLAAIAASAGRCRDAGLGRHYGRRHHAGGACRGDALSGKPRASGPGGRGRHRGVDALAHPGRRVAARRRAPRLGAGRALDRPDYRRRAQGLGRRDRGR